MSNYYLWKYCTPEQCQDMLLSFQLLNDNAWTDEEKIACLYALSRHTRQHYQRIAIPKRNGSLRHLLVPDPLLKQVQKNILHHILVTLPISSYATAYHRGANVISNAAAHIGQRQILKLDIEDFFGNISFLAVYRLAFPSIYFPLSVRTMLTHLCCYQDYLPQGAPTSAAISNLVMKPFDEYIGHWCSARHITYTRYCDDMVFSGDFDHRAVKNKVQNFLQTMGFNLNQAKTRRVFQHQQQMVTGLVVNKKIQAPIQYRKKLRQEIYYCEKYGVVAHLMRMNELNDFSLIQKDVNSYLLSLLGKINFVLHANPNDTYFIKAKSSVQKILSDMEKS